MTIFSFGPGVPPAEGEITISIPRNTMHSFDAPNNKILWSITLHGEIARWPDMKFEFPIAVPSLKEAIR